MIDFVYPLGRGSEWANNELRYSLRSIERNVPMLGRVVIVSRDTSLPLPVWLEPASVTHIKVGDMYTNRTLNTLRKAVSACADERLTPEIAWMNDDILLMQPIGAFRHHHRGRLADSTAAKGGTNDYKIACQHTIRLLHERGYREPLNFATHRPLLIDRARFSALVSPLATLMRPLLWGSVYCNLAEVEPFASRDVKVHNVKQFYSGAAALDVISLGGKVTNDPGVRQWLADHFREPSRFERGAARAKSA